MHATHATIHAPHATIHANILQENGSGFYLPISLAWSKMDCASVRLLCLKKLVDLITSSPERNGGSIKISTPDEGLDE